MNVEAIAARLWQGFRRILIQIGGWIASELVATGAAALAGYMEIRSRRFSARSKRARTPGRKAWLARRARRWARAADWFADQAAEIGERVGACLERLTREASIARNSRLESYRA